MTSKDKLIEFLKSANIEYKEESVLDEVYIDVEDISFAFTELGVFKSFWLTTDY